MVSQNGLVTSFKNRIGYKKVLRVLYLAIRASLYQVNGL